MYCCLLTVLQLHLLLQLVNPSKPFSIALSLLTNTVSCVHSTFGGVIASNKLINESTLQLDNKLQLHIK
jgi:hypothetical protein